MEYCQESHHRRMDYCLDAEVEAWHQSQEKLVLVLWVLQRQQGLRVPQGLLVLRELELAASRFAGMPIAE